MIQFSLLHADKQIYIMVVKMTSINFKERSKQQLLLHQTHEINNCLDGLQQYNLLY